MMTKHRERGQFAETGARIDEVHPILLNVLNRLIAKPLDQLRFLSKHLLV